MMLQAHGKTSCHISLRPVVRMFVSYMYSVWLEQMSVLTAASVGFELATSGSQPKHAHDALTPRQDIPHILEACCKDACVLHVYE